ncbi:alpha/beta fold hydrolase [Nocardioides montaniterrae]
MSNRNRILGSIAGALGIAAAGTALGVARQQRQISHRAGERVAFGALRSDPITVLADDGTPLHVEIDDVERAPEGRRFFRRDRENGLDELTLIFAHGYCLNLDCWHFQRAAYRGLVRTVFYDQRSHGRSGDSPRENSTIDQLGRDLKTIIEAVAPDGPVVVVGHSMGGMTIVALTEQFPEMIGTKVIGVGLVSTTAGGLDSRILVPFLPAKLGVPLTSGAIRTLSRGHKIVDALRRMGSSVATVVTDGFAFGDEVPFGYVEFVDEMLSATPFETVAEFFPNFVRLDKFDCVETLSKIPVTIICGTKDKLTSIGHSRKLNARIEGSELLECEGAGHMVILERHEMVNAQLDQLITAATEGAGRR